MYRLALIGFGNVGQGLAQILLKKGELLERRYGFKASIVAVATLRKGSLYHPTGLDLQALLAAGQAGSFDSYPTTPGLIRGRDPLATIRATDADVVVETTYTNFQTAEPALTHVCTALELGKHVITANKGPVALAYHEIAALAARKQAFFGCEGTVMGGTPALRLARMSLAGCTISGARGVINGTTNFILTQMEQGQSYADALAEAQRLGYAEADPSGDVEGYDALGKLVILANTVMGLTLKFDEVTRQGITHLTPEDIRAAQADNMRWKLIASVKTSPAGTTAYVRPERLPLSDPLANLDGSTNAITYLTDLVGAVTLVGSGAGPEPTGFALLSDLLELHSQDLLRKL
ncbi:MAG: homoserine dehydrogenase [Anaerolineae bacterium]|nr:homoserine dehydrogenase [Anaerolineae bacterium]